MLPKKYKIVPQGLYQKTEETYEYKEAARRMKIELLSVVKKYLPRSKVYF